MADQQWLDWAQRLQALAQNGLTYNTNPFDQERYQAVSEIAGEILAGYTGEEKPVIQGLLDHEAGYATPKLDVRGVVFRGNKLLMVRELSDGGWTLPGGWVDINEPPSLAIEREVMEEAGYKVRAAKLLMVHDRNQHGYTPYIWHIYKLYFLCELLEEEQSTVLHNDVETGGVDFFAENEYPTLSVARVTPEALARIFDHKRHPEWPTDFD
jgi:ADP-ribose pyrophosphatase YjhB (NUDIX family)